MKPTLEQARELAEALGITPDGFGSDQGRDWDWGRDYPMLLRVIETLEPIEASTNVQHGHPSAYWLKHQVENDLGEYVSQGAVILAWAFLGRRLERHPGDRPGAFIAVNRRDPTYKRWLFARNVA